MRIVDLDYSNGKYDVGYTVARMHWLSAITFGLLGPGEQVFKVRGCSTVWFFENGERCPLEWEAFLSTRWHHARLTNKL